MADLLPLLGVWALSVLTPGPDFVIIARYSAAYSRRHGLLVALGSNTAIMIWAAGSVLGLSALMAQLSWLYEIVRLIGALFLVYLGVRMIWATRHARRELSAETEPSATEEDTRSTGLLRAWRIGFLTNASNPKAVVFFGSMMGTFLPRDPSVGIQLATVVSIVTICLSWYSVVAVFFGGGPVGRVYRRLQHWFERVVGAALVALGGRLALER